MSTLSQIQFNTEEHKLTCCVIPSNDLDHDDFYNIDSIASTVFEKFKFLLLQDDKDEIIELIYFYPEELLILVATYFCGPKIPEIDELMCKIVFEILDEIPRKTVVGNMMINCHKITRDLMKYIFQPHEIENSDDKDFERSLRERLKFFLRDILLEFFDIDFVTSYSPDEPCYKVEEITEYLTSSLDIDTNYKCENNVNCNQLDSCETGMKYMSKIYPRLSWNYNVINLTYKKEVIKPKFLKLYFKLCMNRLYQNDNYFQLPSEMDDMICTYL